MVHRIFCNMQVNREKVYGSPRQKLAWAQHFLKARFNRKEAPRVAGLARHIPAGATILDVGAHFGYLTKEFSRLHDGSCQVIAFEPVAYTHSILRRVVAGRDNVRIERKALSNQAGFLDISIPIKASGVLGIGLSHFGPETRRDYVLETIETIPLDSYLAASPLARLDFIKADVEGAELLVLKGAEASLRHFHPALYLELDDNLTRRLGYHPDEVFAFLGRLGYQAYVLDEAGAVMPCDSYEDGGDYFFHAGSSN